MATFLGIYSKHKRIRRQELEAVLADLSMHGERSIVEKELPGWLLCFVPKFSSSFFGEDHAQSFVSGHISFERSAAQLHGTTAETFHRWMMTEENPQTAAQLEGAFAALHYNAATHTLTLVNDKFGIFPMFVYEHADYIFVSNEYQPLASMNSKAEQQLDRDAIAEFFTLGTTLGNKTFYRNINNLAAASYTVITQAGLQHTTYWNSAMLNDRVEANNETILDQLAKDLLETFTRVNREYKEAQVTDLCLLTAGADSRLILATLTEEQRKSMTFFTSNLSFLDSAEDKDVVGATLLTEKFGLKHRVEKISFYENAFGVDYFDTERRLRASHVYGGWHGGELLGGFGLQAAPIKDGLTFKTVDRKLKTLFNWRFRWRLKQHPYATYAQEKEKFALPFRQQLFMTEQLTRSFFTSIYGGTRSYWLHPWHFANNGFSPFWDSRFLQKLLQVPFGQLENYNFYNRLFRLCSREFTAISSNSPLTQRPDSVIPKLDTGTEPKGRVPNMHHRAYSERLNDDEIWHRKFYNQSALKKILTNEFDPLTMRWLDFETWYARYVKRS